MKAVRFSTTYEVIQFDGTVPCAFEIISKCAKMKRQAIHLIVNELGVVDFKIDASDVYTSYWVILDPQRAYTCSDESFKHGFDLLPE